jgi:hypothetical protein
MDAARSRALCLQCWRSLDSSFVLSARTHTHRLSSHPTPHEQHHREKEGEQAQIGTRRRDNAAMHASLLLLLVACVAISIVTIPACVFAWNIEFLLSTSERGCTSLSLLSSVGGGLPAPDAESCPGYEYMRDNLGSNPTGLSATMAAVDPAAGLLHLLEASASGQIISSSPLNNRASSNAARRPLAANVSVAAMTMGVPSSASLTAATPLLMLVYTPALTLQAFTPAGTAGVTSPIYTAAAFKSTFGMSHAVAGVLTLRDDGAATGAVRELYWLGLSSSTPLKNVNGFLMADSSVLHLYVAGLDASGTGVLATNSIQLTGATDVLAMHYAAELKSLLLVTASEVRVVSVPTIGFATSSALTVASVGLAALSSVKVGAPSLAIDPSVFTFKERIGNFAAIYGSSRWLPYAEHLALGVQMFSGSVTTVSLLSLKITSVSGALSVTGAESFSATSLPLILQSSVGQLTVSPTLALARASISALSIATATFTVSGTGFSQPLVRNQLQCVLQGADAYLAPIGSTVTVSATLTSSATDLNPLALETLTCMLPATFLISSTANLFVSIKTADGKFSALVHETFDVNECASPTACTTDGTCTNSVSVTGASFQCIHNACEPGYTGAGCKVSYFTERKGMWA